MAKNMDVQKVVNDQGQMEECVVILAVAADAKEPKVATSPAIIIPFVDDLRAKPVVVEGLRPRQVLAATLLVQGRRGTDVAAALGVSAETISRWRQLPEFQALIHKLLQETIEATKLGMVTLCTESVEQLRYLIRAFEDETSLKAITLVLNKVGPVLGAIGGELRGPPDSKAG